MPRSRLAPRLCALFTLAAPWSCGGDVVTDPFMPRQDEWVAVIDQPFEHKSGDAKPQIDLVVFGSDGTSGEATNFMNRGDVVVRFVPMDTPKIKVWVRKFAFARTVAEAKKDYKSTLVWAFASDASNPKLPADEDPANDCNKSGWKNDCKVLIAYDGVQQKANTGADYYVELPEGYRGKVNVTTRDVLASDTERGYEYHNRGNVCVQNLAGDGEIEVDSGNVFVSVSPKTKPAPNCPDTQVMKCEMAMTGADSTPWAMGCGCKDMWGVLTVNTVGAGASNITVDLPPDLWSYVTAQNRDASATTCEVKVTGLQAWSEDENLRTDKRGAANFPGMWASDGGGYRVSLVSEKCAGVSTTEQPDDYVGRSGSDSKTQKIEPRGTVTACAGCLAGKSCTDLIGMEYPSDAAP